MSLLNTARCQLPRFLAFAAQSQPRHVRESWSTAQGLPQSSVRALVQARDGYLWLATFGGLARFDGTRFVVFDTANTDRAFRNKTTLAAGNGLDVITIGSRIAHRTTTLRAALA